MTIYVLILMEESWIEEEFATTDNFDADKKWEKWIEEHELDEHGSNGDGSCVGYYRTYEM